MFSISLLDGLLGVICGLRFRVEILVPLIATAIIEVAVFKPGGMWSSHFWSAVELITLLEIGFFVGSAIGAYWQYPVAEGTASDLPRRWHGKLFHR